MGYDLIYRPTPKHRCDFGYVNGVDKPHRYEIRRCNECHQLWIYRCRFSIIIYGIDYKWVKVGFITRWRYRNEIAKGIKLHAS